MSRRAATSHLGCRIRSTPDQSQSGRAFACRARIEVTAVRLTIRLLGTEVFHIDTEPDADDDCSRDLSGGTLATDRIDPGPTTLTLGFTGGWECGDDE